ncbi:uncharacterized protein LOC125024897 [Penaeus chinensis]|uniref:uncharacterized protein LOC125024897 n=1 Tax=Penaeus chinensis TaxID=139456 RepID=UPI001FB58C8E|nr:uncharacterized protein LOC125024897 [Penaeus chinensis]
MKIHIDSPLSSLKMVHTRLAAVVALLVIAGRSFTFSQSVEDPAEEAKNEGLPAEDSCRIPGVTYPIGMTYEELVAGLDADALVLIDVRDPQELRESGKLPKSHNVPLPEFEAAFQLSPKEFSEKYGFAKPTPQDENVVLSCLSGCRIVTAWEAIQPFGYCRVRYSPLPKFTIPEICNSYKAQAKPACPNPDVLSCSGEGKAQLRSVVPFAVGLRLRSRLCYQNPHACPYLSTKNTYMTIDQDGNSSDKWPRLSSSGKLSACTRYMRKTSVRGSLVVVLAFLVGADVSFSMTIGDVARGDLAREDGGPFENASCRIPGITYPVGIEFEELAEGLLNDSVVLIDVRNRWELEETGKLPRSQNVPLPEFKTAFNLSPEEFLKKYDFVKPEPEDENVVLTCRSGRRILLAWDAIEPLGYCKVRLYFGSYLDWKARGAPLIPVPGSVEP